MAEIKNRRGWPKNSLLIFSLLFKIHDLPGNTVFLFLFSPPPQIFFFLPPSSQTFNMTDLSICSQAIKGSQFRDSPSSKKHFYFLSWDLEQPINFIWSKSGIAEAILFTGNGIL